MVAPESNDAWPPHPWFLLRDFSHESNQTPGVIPLLLVRNSGDVTLDTDFRGFGLCLHWPAGGCQSSTLFPSGSMTQANFPYSESSIFSRTLQPSSRKTLTRAWRSSTR